MRQLSVELAHDEPARRRLGLGGKIEGERRYNCDAVMSAYEDVYAQALVRARVCGAHA